MKKLALSATPELEDFGHKYTDEGQGRIGSLLLKGYFNAVDDLFEVSGKKNLPGKLKAIEIGCGEGHSTKEVRKILPRNVELQASEYVKKLIPVARKNNPDVKVIHESVYELTHKDKSFDIVFLLEVLEHLDYPDKALAEIRRILKDDGVLVLGVPSEPLWRILNMARGKYLKDFGNTTGHLNHWSPRKLVLFVQDHFGPVRAKKNPLPWSIVLAEKP